MKPIILALTWACLGQTGTPLQTEQAHIDRGVVRRGPMLQQVFALRNTGPTELQIVNVQTSCGCLQPQLSTRTLPAQGAATLTIDVNTLTQPAGQNTWRLTVVGQSPHGTHELELRLSADLLSEVDLTPAALVLAGTQAVELTLTDRRATPLTLTTVQPTAAFLTATLLPTTTLATQRIRVQATGTVPPGRHEAFVCLHSSDPDYPLFKVPVTLTGAATVRRAVPERGTLRQMGQSLLVQLRGPDALPAEIERAEAPAPLELKWAAATLRVRLGTTTTAGQADVRVWVVGQPQPVVVPVTWTVP